MNRSKKSYFRHVLRLVLPVGLLAFCVTCGNEEGGEEGRPSISVSDTNYCAELAKVECYNLMHCCTGAQIEDVLGILRTDTEAECRGDLELLCLNDNAARLWSIDQGTLAIDSTIANTCLEAQLAPEDTCIEHVSEDPAAEACAGSIWIGLVPPGDPCVYSHECEPDSYCSANRTCVTLPGLGEECPEGLCASELRCDYDATPICEMFLDVDDPCTFNGECDAGLICDHAGSESVCANLQPLGSDCNGDAECESGECTQGNCSVDTYQSCTSDAACSYLQSYCEGTNSPCWSDYDCMAPATCEPQTCEGERVCVERYFTKNYCPSVPW
jgi:hypothetical protein